jgi:transmembrane sensor
MSEAERIEREAAQWLSRRVEPQWSDDDQTELEQWLGQGYSHKAAYWRLEEGWERSGRIGALGLGSPKSRSTGHGMFAWKQTALAASVAALVVFGASQIWLSSPTFEPQREIIATPVGARKVVPLNDGSSIELNTATELRAAVTPTKREVWLDKGEAYFDVLHSATVPFIIHAGPKTISVMGTQFSVRRNGDDVIVTVLSGRVRITDSKSPSESSTVSVAAGSVAMANPTATLVAQNSPEAVEAHLAWRDGRLIFRNDTLSEAAAEFNRYNERKMVVAGKAAELKISGSFQASNEDGFARLLSNAYGLNVTVSEQEIRVTD